MPASLRKPPSLHTLAQGPASSRSDEAHTPAHPLRCASAVGAPLREVSPTENGVLYAGTGVA